MATHDLIFLPDESIRIGCSGSGAGNAKYPPRENVITHSRLLLDKLAQCISKTDNGSTEIKKVNGGYYVEFVGKKNFNLKTDSLGSSGLKLLNVREKDKTTYATVFVSDKSSEKLQSKIQEYGTEKSRSGKPKNNDLVSSIEDIRPASFEALWTGYNIQIPKEEPLWCEFWMFKEKTEKAVKEEIRSDFLTVCARRAIQTSEMCMNYPEAVVLEACVSYDDLSFLLDNLSHTVAEIRRCLQPASFYVERPSNKFSDNISKFEKRLKKPDSDDIAICLIDSGVYEEHRLLKPFIPENGIHVVRDNMDPRDLSDHGTRMAGIAIFNDLRPFLESTEEFVAPCLLESVKAYENNLLNSFGQAEEVQFDSHGIDFINCVSIAEYNRPSVKNRIFCSAITEYAPSADNLNIGCSDGSPDSWSAAIDSICSGSLEEDKPKRLFIESAGNNNVLEASEKYRYPDEHFFSFIQSPGQSWNAITVGAYTELAKLGLDEKNAKPVAPIGGLSPVSTISKGWKRAPIKPEVLFEGGNFVEAEDNRYYQPSSLNLVTTSPEPGRPFGYHNGTSAASAQAANFCARLYEKYHERIDLWPETVRALLVHSASWTIAMRKEFLNNKSKNGIQYEPILRACGYGVPDFSKATGCLDNNATLVIQGEIQPFNRPKTKNEPTTSTMNAQIHELPWPSDILSSLGAVAVRLKVTLSYYIEPNPSRRVSKYSSANLTFDVNRPTETKEDFIDRISGSNHADKSGKTHRPDRLWEFGITLHSLGSIHSDFIETSAAELSTIKYLAVYPPRKGWWAGKGKNERPRTMRYSLVVSIETPSLDVPIYESVSSQIKIST